MKHSENISWICKKQKNDLFKCSSVENFSQVKLDNSKLKKSDEDKLKQIEYLESLIIKIKENISKNENLLETLNNL